jgi:CubicO group peptidase (beta-lactamase class C family)
MEAELHRLLPHLKGAESGADLKVADLYNMQSGIRDYWAM